MWATHAQAADPLKLLASPSAFTLSPENEAQRRALRVLLVAQITYERARRIREHLLFLLTSVSIAVWVAAAWPVLLNATLRTAALDGWVLMFVATLSAVFVEKFWHRRSTQALDALRSA